MTKGLYWGYLIYIINRPVPVSDILSCKNKTLSGSKKFRVTIPPAIPSQQSAILKKQ